MTPDYYAILEIGPEASAEEIKKQYRLLAHAWHPDKFSSPEHKKRAGDRLKEINAAYEVLSDPDERARYDSDSRRRHSGSRPEQSERDTQARRQREQAEREAKERRQREQAEREAKERRQREQAGREAEERRQREQAGREAEERRQREQAEREAQDRHQREQKVLWALALLTGAAIVVAILSSERNIAVTPPAAATATLAENTPNSTNTSSPTPTPTPSRTPTHTSTPTATPAMSTVVMVASLHTGPGLNYDVIATIRPNTSVSLVERTATGNWFRVYIPNLSLEGWMHVSTLAAGQYQAIVPIASRIPSSPTVLPVALTLAPTATFTVAPSTLPGGAVLIACNPQGGLVNIANVQAWYIERYTTSTKQTIPQDGNKGGKMAANEQAIYIAKDGSGPYVFCQGVDWRVP